MLLHCITDALLGALCLPDIGQLFPDNDPQWKASVLLQGGVLITLESLFSANCGQHRWQDGLALPLTHCRPGRCKDAGGSGRSPFLQQRHVTA